MKFCQNCGKEINDLAVICPQCGTAVKKEKKKKGLIILIVVGVIILLGIIGSSNNATVVNTENGTVVKQEENKEKEIFNGDKIITEYKEITINSVELLYDVLPDDKSGFYTHYAADQGKVYISVDADVTNIAKQNLPCDEIGRVKAEYNDGYTYNGFVIVEDSTTGFTYANITSIDPLTTQGIKWLIECPQEVEETTNPLCLKFNVDGESFIYNIR